VETKFIHLSIHFPASVTKHSQIFVIFGIGVLYKTLFSTNVSYMKIGSTIATFTYGHKRTCTLTLPYILFNRMDEIPYKISLFNAVMDTVWHSDRKVRQ